MALTFQDPDHSVGEYRFLTFGISATGKYSIVSHTDIDDTIRMISARLMTKAERKIYEEG